jgi:hypothetical protein
VGALNFDRFELRILDDQISSGSVSCFADSASSRNISSAYP